MRKDRHWTPGAHTDQSRRSQQRPNDPFLGLRFWVEIDGVHVAGFSECSGIVMETEVEEYKEGGLNIYTHKIPTRVKYNNLTLKRGIDEGQDLYRWYIQCLDGRTGRRPGEDGTEGGKNISIMIYGPDGTLQKQWDLRRAFPVKWSGPDLKSDAGAVAVETLEIAHEGIFFNNARIM